MKKVLKILSIAEVKWATGLALIILAIISSFLTVIPTNILGALSNSIVSLLADQSSMKKIVSLFITYAAALILGAVVRNIFCYLTSKLANQIIFTIKNICFSKFLNIESRQVSEMDFGTVVNTVIRNAERLELVFSTSLFTLLSDIFDLVIMSIFLIRIAPLALVIFLLVLPITYTLAKKSGTKQKELAFKRIESEKEIINKLNDTYSNFDVIRIFRGEKREKSQFKRSAQDYQDISNRSDKKLSEFFAMEKVIRIIGTVVALSYITMQILRGEINVGSFIIVAMYSEKFFSPVTNMVRYLQYIQKGLASIENILEFLSKDDCQLHCHYEVKNLYPILIKGSALKMTINGSIVGECEDLKIVDKTINLINGENGSGKTSLVRMLLGLIDNNNNKLQVDKGINQDEDIFSYAPQESNMFDLSILENCLYPQSLDEASQDFVEQAVMMLQRLNFPKDLIFESAGELGSKLSGGERKKVSFVRALLHEAPILVLDEITANVDDSSVKIMEKIIISERLERAIVLISHQVNENLLLCSQNVINLTRKSE